MSAEITDPTICCICRFPLNTQPGTVFYGAGGGYGQEFAHEGCYWRRRAETAEAKVAEMAEAKAAQLLNEAAARRG